MGPRDAMLNLLKMYRDYAEDFDCTEETDKTIALAIIALEYYKEIEKNESNARH